MRRVATVGALLLAISSFLALQSICRPYLVCLMRTCETGETPTVARAAWVAVNPVRPCADVDDEAGNRAVDRPCRGGDFGETPCRSEGEGTEAAGCHGLDGDADFMPCLATGDFSFEEPCCRKGEAPQQGHRCPKKFLSCFFCVPARFVWEPPPVHATRDTDHAHAVALIATTAMNTADLVRQLTHSHSPPGLLPASAGVDRRISICSYLL